MKRNVPIVGFVLGLIFPLIGIFIMYLAWSRNIPFRDYVLKLTVKHDITSKVLSIAILLNLLPFLYFTNKRLDYSARGVLVATIIYALVILLTRFVL